MSYAHTLKYAGSDPFEPETDRKDISPAEMERLTEDETYRRLAEVRYLANRLELNLDCGDSVPTEVWREVFDVVAADGAPLQEAVEVYVDRWLADFREPSRSEPADFGGGETTGVQDL